MDNNQNFYNHLFSKLNNEEGWTEKMRRWYMDTIKKESDEKCFDKEYMEWAHQRGFYAESACSYQLNTQNIGEYLSDHDYLKVWPLNGWTRIWVNDKLTLKYILANTEFDQLMPRYYYYSTPSGLKSLVDNPYSEATDQNFLRLLSEIGDFACKPCNGTTAIGFVRLSFKDGQYYMNSEPVQDSEVLRFVHSHPNYVFTEYLRPSKHFARYSPLIHTLRLVTLNYGGKPKLIGGYLRLPCHYTGEANYTIPDGTNTNGFNVFVDINTMTGEYGNAKKTFINRVEPCEVHPDSGEKISGIIDNFEELKRTVLSVADRFNTLDWLGFDIGITENGFKCMEINTHPGIKYMQIFKPLLKDETLKAFFYAKLQEIDSLTMTDKQNRLKIVR